MREVAEAMRERRYHPNETARGLTLAATQTLGFSYSTSTRDSWPTPSPISSWPASETGARARLRHPDPVLDSG